ncbi:hypothetical protein ElyMa_004548500 [Elysia marginata]|uniref:Uncharacterized protein n=1 Tax=Elysia marginata TaxID=1093978 RepID=A0AAV4HPS5_9GAST|nr:hypothetical protein ElyMa_004548500 [Elysia marginata]
MHIVIGVKHLNLIHSLLLLPKRTEKVINKCKKTTEVSKLVPVEKLASTLVHRWVTPKGDLDSLQEGAQYPLNRLKQFLSSPRNGVLVSLHPRSAGKCAVDEVAGNHLHIILRHMGDLSLLRETAKAFKAIGGYCIGTVIKDNAITETVAYLKKPGHMFLGTTSKFLLDLWNNTEVTDGVYDRDLQWCLPDSAFQDLGTIEDETRAEEIERCEELPFTIRQEVSKTVTNNQHKKRKLVIVDSDEEGGCDSEDTIELY